MIYMDQDFKEKISSIIHFSQEQLKKDNIDHNSAVAFIDLNLVVIDILLRHIDVLETKLASTINSNQIMAVHYENLIAEYQRLNQIAKY